MLESIPREIIATAAEMLPDAKSAPDEAAQRRNAVQRSTNTHYLQAV
jgi:hypothetical protein